MENEYSSTNFHLDWIDYIYNQVKKIQDMQRIASEGAVDLMDYLEIPIDKRKIVCPDAQYSNLKYLILELDLTITNTSKILADKTEAYRNVLDSMIKSINRRDLFLKEVFMRGQLYQLNITEFFYNTRSLVFKLCRDLISDISSLLYLEN